MGPAVVFAAVLAVLAAVLAGVAFGALAHALFALFLVVVRADHEDEGDAEWSHCEGEGEPAWPEAEHGFVHDGGSDGLVK